MTVAEAGLRTTSAVMPPRDLASAPRPISGFVPRGRLAAAANSPQRALDDARRLARLLISEIKLYNEKKVDDGRAAGDLYERLKDDIERSRQVYDERTPATSDRTRTSSTTSSCASSPTGGPMRSAR